MKKTNIKLLDFPLVHLFRCLRSEYCLPFFSSSRYVSFPFPVSYLSYLSCFFLCPSTDTQKVDIFTYVLFQFEPLPIHTVDAQFPFFPLCHHSFRFLSQIIHTYIFTYTHPYHTIPHPSYK